MMLMTDTDLPSSKIPLKDENDDDVDDGLQQRSDYINDDDEPNHVTNYIKVRSVYGEK